MTEHEAKIDDLKVENATLAYENREKARKIEELLGAIVDIKYYINQIDTD